MTSKKKKNRYRAQRHEEKKQIQEEKRRFKALPKPLKKLETELNIHVEFMEVYDGYIGDFTGEIVPVEPVKNPFTILKAMNLNLPHKNALNNDSIIKYIRAIEEAFSKMAFYTNTLTITKTKLPELYETLCYYINNPPKENFNNINELTYKNISFSIERMNSETTEYLLHQTN